MAFFGGKQDNQNNPSDGNVPPVPDQGYGGYDQYSQQQQPYPQDQQQYGQEMGQQDAYASQGDSGTTREEIEEVAEAIVEEKWKDKQKELDKLSEWKEEVNTKLTQLQQQVDDLKNSFNSLHKGLLGKISEYDENLLNVGTEIKAMEKVFSKVLPSLTDSVNKMQRMANNSTSSKKK